MKEELRLWFGATVSDWQMLDERVIDYALPAQQHVRHDLDPAELRLSEHLYQCGDHLLNGSINGAMRCGRLAAETIVAER